MSAEAPQKQRSEAAGHFTLGPRLRAERERQGTKLVKIAAETRVGVHYLAALEHSDYEELPGEVFTKGYVRAYAEFLGLDAEEMTELYLGETVERRAAEALAGDEKIVREMSRVLQVAPDRSHYLLWSAVATVLLLLTVAVGWWLLVDPDPEQPALALKSSASNVAALTTADAAKKSEPKTTPTGTTPTESTPTEIESNPQTKPAAASVELPVIAPVPLEAEADDTPLSQAAESVSESALAKSVQQRSAPAITVSEFGVGLQVVDRNLIGRGDSFKEGTEVWFWTRVLGAEPGTILQHVWLHDGVEIARTSLNIGASHWRTQSRKTLHPGSAGNWAVEVRDPAGKTLARSEFSCEAAG